jgi:calcium-dependent protein kinase
MILHLLEEEIDHMTREKTEQGELINANSIDRGTVFRKLKIDISSFICIIHDSAANHYHFKETIGEGSFGKVYRAVCKRTKEERAIKVLKHKIAKQEDAKFLAEFHLLSQLDHPNIVKLYEIYYYRSFYYVVMEYCKGGSIIELIKQLRQFPEALVVSIAQQLLAALAYLHQQGIVHRDIKLDNIVFLDTKGQHGDYHIKLIDFGTAIRRDEGRSGKARMAGTRYYMAPEVFKGVLHEKSDLWSCGIFLHVFFTGKFPFTGKSLAEVEHAICTKTVTFVGTPLPMQSTTGRTSRWRREN